MHQNRLFPFAAPRFSRGGFTLIELLVVIGIIGILAAATVPAVLGGLNKAKQNVAMQNAKNIGTLMFQFSMDNDGNYPPYTIDASNAYAGTSSAAFEELIANKYVQSADIFFLSGGNATRKYAGPTPATGLDASNVSWSVTGIGTQGITQNDPDQTPLVYASGNSVNVPNGPGPASAVCNGQGKNPFGTAGIPVCYKGTDAKFLLVRNRDGKTVDEFVPTSFAGTSAYNQLNP